MALAAAAKRLERDDNVCMIFSFLEWLLARYPANATDIAEPVPDWENGRFPEFLSGLRKLSAG
jgi:hypothetical protein